MNALSRHPDARDGRGSDHEPIARVLVVDDDPVVAKSLCAYLTEEGYDVATAPHAKQALQTLARAKSDNTAFQLVITDVMMPGTSGLELVRALREQHPSVVPIVLTGHGTVESAVSAIRGGAFDYLVKPVVDEELRMTLERALHQQMLLAENTILRKQLDEKSSPSNIVGRDPQMMKVMDTVNTVAASKVTVLMTGESGTGKSLVARAIHRASTRADKPYIEIYCGSISETLLESELFGHVKGAYTGAHTDTPGRFLAAHDGTIFIDEINSASPAMQLKLLRVLQDRCFEPIGSNETITVDVRVILATNESLEELVAGGTFREDLYYRINVIKIELPSLRKRPGDIPLLAAHFLEKHAREHERNIVAIAPDAMQALENYNYPGNVRELENLIERAVVLSPSPTIELDMLPPCVLQIGDALCVPHHGSGSETDAPWTPMPLDKALEEPERRILLKALDANDWNRKKTADDLGINRTTLYKKMRSLGIERLAS